MYKQQKGALPFYKSIIISIVNTQTPEVLEVLGKLIINTRLLKKFSKISEKFARKAKVFKMEKSEIVEQVCSNLSRREKRAALNKGVVVKSLSGHSIG